MKVFCIAVIGLFLFPGLVSAKFSNDANNKQWAYEHTKVYEAWDYTIGSHQVVVAVIDNGFDTFHPDLKDNVWKNEDEIPNNNIDDDNNGYVDDVWGWNFVTDNDDSQNVLSNQTQKGNNDPRPQVEGLTDSERKDGVFNHGTLVAGLIGGVGNNGLDGVGVNWQVRLMNLKVIDNSGVGDLSPLKTAIYYAVDNGADIINISMVGGVESAGLKEAVKYAYDNGVVVVAAAGNSLYSLNDSPMYPICLDAYEKEQWILGVSAIDKSHHLAIFSNTGSNCVDITAPGVDVYSTMRYSPSNGLSERYGGGWNGTSFATPLVSGAAALIKSIQPTWGPQQIYNTLLTTVHHTPNQDENNYANLFGAGLLQIDKAVEYAMSQLGKTKTITQVASFNFDKGVVSNYLINKKSNTEKELLAVKEISDVAVWQESGKNKFVTVKVVGRNKSEVTIYNNNWQKINSWSVSSAGDLRVVAGDVAGDEEIDIILAPAYGSSQVFRVFDKIGKELAEYSLTGKHQGVSLALVDGLNGEKKSIVAFYDFNGLQISRFGGSQMVEKFLIKSLSGVGEVGVGDVDGDGEEEYVLSGGEKVGNYLLILEKDGTQKKKYTAFDAKNIGTMSLQVANFDGDNKDDIIVSWPSLYQPVRVWNGSSVRKIIDWQPFGGKQLTQKILVY